jgi:hypothetical protein
MKDFPGPADTGGIQRLKLCPACRQHAPQRSAFVGTVAQFADDLF